LVAAADAPGSSSTKTWKSTTKKKLYLSATLFFFTSTSCLLNIKTHICTSRSCPSPNKKVAKKIFTGEETADGSGSSDGGAATSD